MSDVKKINGYNIKDEVARNNVDHATSAVEYIFPKALATSGDCNLIRYRNKVIMIDCHASSEWSNINQMLEDNDITHIDYLIITHYHSDHVGNFQNLIDNHFIDSNTNYFMPPDTTKFGTSNNTQIANMKQLFTELGFTYYSPAENETLIIEDDLKLTFVNCDPEELESYYPNSSSSINATSTVVIVEHRGVRSVYMADCTPLAYKRIKEEEFIKGKVDLFKIGHHGIDEDTDQEFVRKLNPLYAVQTSGIADFSDNKYVLSNQLLLLEQMNTVIYQCHMQNSEYIKFLSNGSMQNISGLAYESGGIYTDYDIYVDPSVTQTDYQDGTQEHPFIELPQALTTIRNYVGQKIIIHLAAGHYGLRNSAMWEKNMSRINNYGGIIEIVGNTSNVSDVIIDRGFIVYNSNVTFKYLTFDVSKTQGINCTFSNIVVDHCVFTSESHSNKAGIFTTASQIYVVDTTFNNMNSAIANRTGTKLMTVRTKFNNVTNNLYENQDTTFIVNYNNQFDTASDKYFDLKSYSSFARPILIYQDTGGDYTIKTANLPITLDRVEAIEIEYKSSSGVFGSTGKIYNPANKTVSFQTNNIVTNDGYMFAIGMLTIGTNSITLSDQQIVKVSTQANVSLISGDHLKIVRVIAHLNAYRNLT